MSGDNRFSAKKKGVSVMADGPSYTAGYRAEAADFAAASGKPIAQVAATSASTRRPWEDG